MVKKDDARINSHLNPPVWEWIIAAIGLGFVLAAVGTAVYRAATEGTTPPALTFSVESISRAGDGYVVQFQVANTGDQTAAGLAVEGQLKKDGKAVETSTANLAYAPANATRHGGLYFKNDPHAYELGIRATGYEKP